MRVIITGSSGRLGRILAPYLLTAGLADSVIGIDIQPAPFSATGYRHEQIDIRSNDTDTLFKDADALVHLAFVLMGGGLGRQRHDRESIRSVNVEGSRKMFMAAAHAGLQHAIFVSSAAVYGAWPDNPPRIPESAPLRAMPGFAYAEDKIAVEHWLDHLTATHHAIKITRLRPHAILGKHAHPLLNALFRQPIYPLAHPPPMTQCIWEQDVVSAIALALQQPVSGTFNLAADPPMSLYDMLGLVHRWRLPMHPAILSAIHHLAWHLTPVVGEPGWIRGLRYPLVLDTRLAQSKLGFTPKYTVPDCVRGAANRWHND